MKKASHIDAASDRRRSELAAIHVATKQLGIDRDTYVAIVQRVGGVSTSADLDGRGRRALLDELRRLGAPQSPKKGHRGAAVHGRYPGKPHNADSQAMPGMIDKVEALLADMKLSWAYADGIVSHMYGIERVAWCRDPAQLRGLIAALHAKQEKQTLNASIDALLLELRISAVDLVDLLRPLRPNWRSHRPSLRLVRDYLADRRSAMPSTTTEITQ